MARYPEAIRKNPEMVASIKMVNQMASYLSRKYKITNKQARLLISKASEYNPRNKKEAYAIIDKLYHANKGKFIAGEPVEHEDDINEYYLF